MNVLHRLTSLVLWGLVIALAGIIAGTGASSGQDLNHADLVIVFPDGRVETRSVLFEEEEISGAELLRRSGLSIVFSSTAGFGEGVCRIGDTGCSNPGSCYCQCSGGDCEYWAYFGLAEGEWRFQNVGPSQRMIRDGDTDAWVWGAGGGPPPAAELTAACDDREVTAVPVATNQPAPAATPFTTELPVVEDEPVATRAGAIATEPAQVVGEAENGTEDAEAEDVVELEVAEDDGGGAPVGLIAFGAVAAALVVIAAGLAIRRRAVG